MKLPRCQNFLFLSAPTVADIGSNSTDLHNMPQRVNHVAEVLLSGSLAIIALATRALIAFENAPQAEAMSWLLLPLIGSVMASIGAFLFNPSIEDRRTVAGRMVVGVFCGITVPNVAFYMSDTLQKASVVPAVQLLLGFGICAISFMMAKPLFQGGYKRSNEWADAGLDELERRAGVIKSDTEKLEH